MNDANTQRLKLNKSDEAAKNLQCDIQILIVEDDPLSAEILKTLLTQHGLDTFSLENPDQLKNHLEGSDHPDLIFLDLEFTNHDGIEAFLEFKKSGLIGDIRVIAYSVHISEIDRVRKAGMQGFIGKPLKQELFNDQLDRILNGLPVWDA